MSKNEILSSLADFKTKQAAAYGIVDIWLFGSRVKDTETVDSDVAVVVKLSKQDLFALIGIKQDLEQLLHSQVDIVSYRESMNPLLKKRSDQDAVYV